MEKNKGHLEPWTLMPAKKGTCSECATDHTPDMPHNKDSLFYQYDFYNKNGRWPSWKDAMVHCDERTKELWTMALEEQGVDIGEETKTGEE